MTASGIHGQLKQVERSVILPSVLLINFGIFQYLVLLFHNKARRQPYVCLLLLTSAISFVVLVPYATQDAATVDAMNDVSESCLALMLLVQTTFALSTPKVVDHDPDSATTTSTTKIKNMNLPATEGVTPVQQQQRHKQRPQCMGFRSIDSVLRVMKVLADLLILFDCLAVVLGIIGIFSPSKLADFGGADEVNNNSEVLTLAYTFFYRFGALALHKGSVRAMLREDAIEVVAHVVFAMHEYPFLIAFNATGVDWEPVQILFMRLALAPCVWMTIGEHHYRHPTQSQLTKLSVPVLHELIQRASLVAETKAQSRTNSVVRAADSGPDTLPDPSSSSLTTEPK